MRRKIPSTGMLVAFEAAARHQSFTRAAQELFLTQSAICRQIAALEDFIGVPLFRRARQGVKLTEAGAAYSRQMAARLDEVERDTLAIMANAGHGAALELAVVPTFATRWLLPRLAAHLNAGADFSVNMTTRTRPFLFADTEFDAAIYYGTPDWPGTEADFLMPENAVPVCSPTMRERLGKGRKIAPDAIARLPLLQQTTRPYAWRQWFEAQGIEAANDLNGPRFELFSMLAEAAMHDLGVALIPPFLIRDEIGAGRLVALSDRTVPSDKAYYLIMPRQKTGSAALQRFREWLLATAAAYRDGAD
jgi:LysR family glycine cleavage system transcriptional activator